MRHLALIASRPRGSVRTELATLLALALATTVVVLVTFAAANRATAQMYARSQEWLEHAVAMEAISVQAHEYMSDLIRFVSAPDEKHRAHLEESAHELRSAAARSTALGRKFSREEQDEEAELAGRLEALLAEGERIAAAPDLSKVLALDQDYEQHLAPAVDHRVADELAGSRAADAEATAEGERVLRWAIAWSVSALLLVAVVATVRLRRLARHLADLTHGAGRIAAGDFGATLAVDSSDELGTLARAFNEMASSLAANTVTRAQLEEQVRARTVELERSTRQLEDNLQRLAQAQAQLLTADRMAALGMLAAGVAHEINNPLSFVTANLSYVREGLEEKSEPVEELVAALNEAADGARRVRDIVRDLKSFSRTGEEKLTPVELVPVLESALHMVANEFKYKATISREYGATPPVMASEGKLAQVFLNLLVNSAQAMSERDLARNKVRVVTSTDSRGHAVVEVSDNGPGMSPEVAARVFEPFFTTKPRGVGTGLGLPICKSIVELFHGDLTLTTAPGAGTTFRVALPPSSELPVSRSDSPLPAPAPRRGRVLVIDDEAAVGRIVERTLREHEVVMVTDPHVALSLLTGAADFDVVFCDVMMPTLSGCELYQQVAASAPEVASRFVFLTGGAFSPEARDFLEQQPLLRLDKPFDPGAMRTLVAERVAARAR